MPQWPDIRSSRRRGKVRHGAGLGRSRDARRLFFGAVHSRGKVALFFIKNGRRLGFEFKCADAPTMTRSMQTVMSDLKLDHLTVVYPGSFMVSF
jgi:hypothetical protein